jgi:hypothetical protein
MTTPCAFALCPVSLPLMLALALGCAPAGAETSPWSVGVSQALSHDSNLYRVDTSAPLGQLSRSDTVYNTSLFAGLDQPIGRQRLYGQAKLGYSRYSHNDYLNDTLYTLSSGLDWSTLERVSGQLGVAVSRNQRQFNQQSDASAVEVRKNNENVTQVDSALRVGVVTPLTLEATLGWRRVRYSAPEYDSSAYRQSRGSLGLRYRPAVATWGVAVSLADIRYDTPATQASGGLAAEQVRRTSVDLTMQWPLTGASSLYARLSPTRAVYEQFTQRDYAGWTGALRWNWRPTGKLQFETRWLHEISQDSNFETFGGPSVVGTSQVGRTTTEWQLSGGYELTAKFTLNVMLVSTHRSLDRVASVADLALVTATGKDDTHTLSLGARWTPVRSVQLSCNLAREQRAARGDLTQDYRSTTVGCLGQLTLR